MGHGVNKVILVGHLGSDPEGRVTQGGAAVTNLSVATTRSWKNQQSGEKEEQTEWHRVVLFGRTAEVAQEYLRKGAQIYLEGRLQTRKWQDKSGYDRYTTEVVGDTMQMLGGKGDEGKRGPYSAHSTQSKVEGEVAQSRGSGSPDFVEELEEYPF